MGIIEMLGSLVSNMSIVEMLGLIGSALFFGSWLLQFWESRQAGKSIVSFNFFLLRGGASILLILEAINTKSVGLIFMTAGTLGMNIFNMFLIIKNNNKK